MTEAGRGLLPHARKILAAVNDAHAAMIASTPNARAHVEIVANESVSTYLLPDILRVLRERWPRTRFTVTIATCAGVRNGVAGGAFDVGLMLGPTADKAHRDGFRPRPFADHRVVIPSVSLVLFAAGSHPLVRGGAPPAVRHDALSGYRVFVSDAAGEFHDLVDQFFTREAGDAPLIEAAGSIEGVKKAVLADGQALGLLPLYSVAEELRVATIVRVNLRPAPPRMRLDALLSRSRVRHPSAEELLVAIEGRG